MADARTSERSIGITSIDSTAVGEPVAREAFDVEACNETAATRPRVWRRLVKTQGQDPRCFGLWVVADTSSSAAICLCRSVLSGEPLHLPWAIQALGDGCKLCQAG